MKLLDVVIKAFENLGGRTTYTYYTKKLLVFKEYVN